VHAFEPNYEGSSIVWGREGAVCSAIGSHQAVARAGHHLAPRRLASGRDVYEELGDGFTLIDLDGDSGSVQRLRDSAAALRVPLKVVTQPDSDARDFYGQRLILVRPDQFVAWSGDVVLHPEAVLKRAIGSDAI
jgi:hypothetical protein